MAEQELKDRLSKIEGSEAEALQKTEKFLELVNSAYLSYQEASFTNRRELVKTVTSNFFVKEKSVRIKPNLPFEMIINRHSVGDGGPYRDRPRTFQTLLSDLVEHFKK